MITKMITEDEPADGVGGCLDLPPKQSLTDLTFVFSNTGLASLVKTITLYAQPYITSPDNDLRFSISHELRNSRHAEIRVDSLTITNRVVDDFEARNTTQQKFAMLCSTPTGSQQLRALIDRLPHIQRVMFQCHDYWHGYLFFSQEQATQARVEDPFPNHWSCAIFVLKP